MEYWTKVFLINWLLNVLIIEFLAIRKIKSIINVNEERDSKYPAFRRTDTKWFSRWWLYPICHLNLLKLVICFLCIGKSALVTNLVTLGTNKDEPITGWRYKACRLSAGFTAAVLLHCASNCVWLSTKRPKVCYKKFLGPDWKPDYDLKHCGSIVSNHSSFMDTMVHSIFSLSSFIAKKEVQDILFIGPNARAMQCLFIDREAKGRGSIQD
jgi:hypothetical protein